MYSFQKEVLQNWEISTYLSSQRMVFFTLKQARLIMQALKFGGTNHMI